MGIDDQTTTWSGEEFPDPFPGEYLLIERIGHGAHGDLWLARQLNVGSRLVAIKTIRVPANSAAAPLYLDTLRKDTEALAKVTHRNIVRVIDLRTSAFGQPYLILEYVEGGSLKDLLDGTGGPIPWREAARYVADVGEALAQAHSLGLIHRDVKPSNILLDATSGEARLTDFGVSAYLTDPPSGAGTPGYMAPEAPRCETSPALDVFSLAATFYHLASGAVPFPAPIRKLRDEQVRRGLPDSDPKLRDRAVPEGLQRIIRAGLSFEPTGRPGLGAMVHELRIELNRAIVDQFFSDAALRGGIRLVLNREVSPGLFRPITTPPPRWLGPTRNILKRDKSVVETPRVRSGDSVRVDVVADGDGYVAVFSLGPTGDLALLYPDPPPAPPPPILKGGIAHSLVEVTFGPPSGRERLFAVWSARPLRLDEILNPAGPGESDVSGPYRATRKMVRIQEQLRNLPPGEAQAVVLELDHVDAEPPG